MPPAKRPPSWGAPLIPLSATSLPALALPASGRGGANGDEVFGPSPGTGGAPNGEGPVLFFPSMIGAERSTVTVLRSRAPFSMSPSSAPWNG